MEHTDNCGRSGRKDVVVANCKMDCACKCHLEKSRHNKYLCKPCPECGAKLGLFDRYKKTLEGLTPGGSEYVNDPERCGITIREIMRGPITLIKRQKAELEAGEEMLEALKDARLCLSEFSKRRQVADGPLSETFERIRAVIAKAESKVEGE